MHEGTTMRVDPSNAEQLRAWDGDQGAYWAARAERFDEGVAGYQDRLLAAAAIEPGSTVLDVGCGAGRTTRDAARLADTGTALGVDLSSRVVDLARDLADREGLGNARFLRADAQVHPFPDGGFDVVVSRHGAMFFGDPLAAFANLARATRPGGRLALLSWQPPERNEWLGSFRAAMTPGRELPPAPPPTPGSLRDPDQVRELLTAAGFADVRLHGLTEPMYFGRDVDDASRFVLGQFGWMTDGLDEADRARAVADLRADMADHLTDRGVRYGSAAWLIQARRP
ncbi:class I SAM-dependent methyltransferase [Saccharothrix sp. BKS2]|uniref:class I SAM-dependent methyltransferase n=1 Tax=Saccharothrix sp. BKS2 TaxID=3064400 RepID=UPI0039EBF40D